MGQITTKPKKKGGGRPPKTPPVQVVAEILIYADKETVAAAAAKYGVSDRTIHRWKARVELGTWQPVADLVAKTRAAIAVRVQDLLTEAYEVSLRRVIAEVPTASIDQAIRAAEMCGGLKLTRDALGGEPGRTPVEGSNPATTPEGSGS